MTATLEDGTTFPATSWSARTASTRSYDAPWTPTHQRALRRPHQLRRDHPVDTRGRDQLAPRPGTSSSAAGRSSAHTRPLTVTWCGSSTCPGPRSAPTSARRPARSNGGSGCTTWCGRTRSRRLPGPEGELELAGDNTYDLPSVPTWSRDGMVVIGDAAHAPAPSSGQGASMALEDAVVLAQALRDGSDVSAGLAAYETGPAARVEKIVAARCPEQQLQDPGPDRQASAGARAEAGLPAPGHREEHRLDVRSPHRLGGAGRLRGHDGAMDKVGDHRRVAAGRRCRAADGPAQGARRHLAGRRGHHPPRGWVRAGQCGPRSGRRRGAALLRVRRRGGRGRPDWDEGMGASLRTGLQSLGGSLATDAAAALVTLVDLPDVGRCGRTPAARPACHRGHPRPSDVRRDARPPGPDRAGLTGPACSGRDRRPGRAVYLGNHRVTPIECGDLATGQDVEIGQPADQPAPE